MEKKIEIWKDIEGWEGQYQVSNLGRVRSLDRYIEQATRWGTITQKFYKGKIKVLRPLHGGYLGAQMKHERQAKMMLVHRLVADAFIPNPDNLPQVNHRNEDKTDNRVENLEWCDPLYNIRYGTGMARKRKQYTEVIQMDANGKELARFPSILAAAEAVGTLPSTISKCIRGVHGSVTAGGYRWRSAEPIKKRNRKQ